jgi:hypothetical protein
MSRASVLAKLQTCYSFFLSDNWISSIFRWHVWWHREMEGPQSKEGKRCLWIHGMPKLLWYVLYTISPYLVYMQHMLFQMHALIQWKSSIFTLFYIYINTLHIVDVVYLNISIILYVHIFKFSRINHAAYVIRPWEVGMPCLSWNWPAKQQGTPPTPRSQAVAWQDVQRQDTAKVVDYSSPPRPGFCWVIE